MALGLQGVVEQSHMDHPDFRAFGRIFATLTHDETRGMVSLTPDQQARVLADHPGMFVPAAGAWGRGGSTMVELQQADGEVVGEAMTLAWQNAAAKKKNPATSSRAPKSKPRSAPKKAAKRTPVARKRPARKRR